MSPLETFRFHLRVADALAYERLPRELAGREKLLLFAIPFAVGALAAALPADWLRVWRWSFAALFGLAAGGLLFGLRDAVRRRRAGRVAAGEGETTVEDWGDHLAVSSASGQRFVALELIAQVICTDAHVFIRHDGGPTILPLRAFEDAADMRAYAEVLDKRSRDALA